MTTDGDVCVTLTNCPQTVYIANKALFSLLIYFIASVSNRAPLREGLTSCSAAACCQPFLRLHERTLIPIH